MSEPIVIAMTEEEAIALKDALCLLPVLPTSTDRRLVGQVFERLQRTMRRWPSRA